MSKLPSFVMVMAVSPRGEFRRCGLLFTRMWRALQIGDEPNLAAPIPVIDKSMYERILADAAPRDLFPTVKHREPLAPPVLAVKAASEDEVAALRAQQATAPGDPEARAQAAEAKVADLEARLMRLELAAKAAPAKPAKDEKGAPPAKADDAGADKK